MRLELEATLASEQAKFLAQLGAYAERQGLDAYLVGGTVRDLILRSSIVDIDVLIAGDSNSFASRLKEHWLDEFPNIQAPSRVIGFRKYLTSKLIFSEPLFGDFSSIDFATTRREYYPTPGAPPIVEAGELKEDLARRDFSINALALSLCPSTWGEITDHHGGMLDLKCGAITVLHPKSFADDPARMLRALRFKVRFGFQFSLETKRLFELACRDHQLKTLPPFRLFDEFRKALLEPNIFGIVSELVNNELLSDVHPDLVFDEGFQEFARQLPEAEPWEQALVVLGRKLSTLDFVNFTSHNVISGEQKRRLVHFHSLLQARLK